MDKTTKGKDLAIRSACWREEMIMDLVYMLSILQLLIAPSILIDTDTDSEVIGCEEEDRLCPRRYLLRARTL